MWPYTRTAGSIKAHLPTMSVQGSGFKSTQTAIYTLVGFIRTKSMARACSFGSVSVKYPVPKAHKLSSNIIRALGGVVCPMEKANIIGPMVCCL